MIRFIDATKIYAAGRGINVLDQNSISAILNLVEGDVKPFVSRDATLKDLAANSWSWSVSQYVERGDRREKIDVVALEKEMRERRAKIASLLDQIDVIVSELRP